MRDDAPSSDALRERYLALLEGSLLGTVHQNTFTVVGNGAMPPWSKPLRRAFRMVQTVGLRRGYELVVPSVPAGTLEEGRAWPLVGETMVGRARLRNVRDCLETVLAEGIDGDFIETGVWRGGCSILAAAVLDTAHPNTKRVYVADSFCGLPSADFESYPDESPERMSAMTRLAVSRAQVEQNFHRYGVSGDRVVFVEGWFSDTLPRLSENRWSVMRLDGDMYESTMDALTALYPRLSVGGFTVVDDYWEMASCRAAVDAYRKEHAIDDPLIAVDHACVMWRRSR